MSSIEMISRRSCLTAALAAIGGATLGAGFPASAAPARQVGRPAPPFKVYTFRGETFTSEELAGKVVVLNFWASWCEMCTTQMAMFDRWMRSHPGADVKVFSVLARDGTALDELRPYAMKVAFSVATHLSGDYAPIDDILPTTYVIDRSGVLRYAVPGAFTSEGFEAMTSQLLAAPV